jgi:hypothetical protein
MRPRIALIIAAALVLVLCEGMADQAAAKVVRINNAAPSNPAVEAGGLRLRHGAPPPVQYSLIGALALPPPTQFSMAGALASQSRWLRQWAFWPCGSFGSLSFHHQSFHHFGPFGLFFPQTRPFRIPARPPIDWMLPLFP